MLLSKTETMSEFWPKLERFNIRTVGQLVSARHNDRMLRSLSNALGLDEVDLVDRIERLRAEFPDADVPKAKPRHYAYGHRGF
jgi:hypothetical protein